MNGILATPQCILYSTFHSNENIVTETTTQKDKRYYELSTKKGK